MQHMNKPTFIFLIALTLPPGAWAADEPASAPASAQEGDVKKLFSKNCALCHFDYGKAVGRGAPKLAGTQLSEKGVYDRIANGKSGMMPGFKKLLTEAEIQALTEYIKALPAN
jgi:mono/diheme cytochrome c family protein